MDGDLPIGTYEDLVTNAIAEAVRSEIRPLPIAAMFGSQKWPDQSLLSDPVRATALPSRSMTESWRYSTWGSLAEISSSTRCATAHKTAT